MARYVAKPDEWLKLQEPNGTLQNIDKGVIEVSSENSSGTGIKLGMNQMLTFSGDVYVRSLGNRHCVFTTVPFDALGGGGDGGGDSGSSVTIKVNKVVLWQGEAFEEGQELYLSDEITNYDEIMVVLGLTSDKTMYVSNTCIVGTNPYMYISWLNNNFSGGYVAKLDVSTNKNKITLVQSSRLNENVAIIYIYGIKYSKDVSIKLYNELNDAEDGAITPKAVKDAIAKLYERLGGE